MIPKELVPFHRFNNGEIDFKECITQMTELYTEVAMEKKRYTKVIDTGLTYGRAMDKLMLEGKKVTRKVWGGYWEVQHVGNFSGSPSWSGKFIVAVLKDGGYAIATPYQEDIFANDWMVVE